MKSNKNIFKPNKILQIRLNIFIGVSKEGSDLDEIETDSSGADEGNTTDELSLKELMKEILQTKEADEGNTTDKVDKSSGERIVRRNIPHWILR